VLETSWKKLKRKELEDISTRAHGQSKFTPDAPVGKTAIGQGPGLALGVSTATGMRLPGNDGRGSQGLSGGQGGWPQWQPEYVPAGQDLCGGPSWPRRSSPGPWRRRWGSAGGVELRDAGGGRRPAARTWQAAGTWPEAGTWTVGSMVGFSQVNRRRWVISL
jgi:hypothetical protein